MKKTQKPLIRAAAAAIGVCALTLGGAALPAFAEESVLGAEAFDLSAVDKYELAAAQTDSSVEALKKAEADGEISVSEGGHYYFIDKAHGVEEAPSFGSRAVAAAAAIPGTPATGSLPGAPVTIYLNFGGETVTNTNWNIEADSDSMAFVAASAADADFQKKVWASVAEDYAPFNVNVTTTRPTDDKLYKTSASDNEYGVNVVITDSYDEVLPDAAGSGGIAYVNALGAQFLSPAFVFTTGTGNIAKSVAEAASHEAGHNFGLSHDGIGNEEYFNADAGIWGPTMGASYVPPLTQWSNGDYAGATNQQDDVAEITNRGAATAFILGLTYADGSFFAGGLVCGLDGADPASPQIGDRFEEASAAGTCDGTGAILTALFNFTDRADYRVDNVGNTTGTAIALDNSTGSFSAADVIITRADVDVYSFGTEGGVFSASVEVADVLANLDSKLTLSDASGTAIEVSDPATSVAGDGTAAGLNASISRTLAAGTYYLSVEGTSFGDNELVTPSEANGYSDYGSLGNYTLTGEAPAPAIVVDAPVITAPANGASIDGVTFQGTGTAGAVVTVAYTLAGGTAQTGTATVGADGIWAFTPAAELEIGEYTVTATQVVDGVVSPLSNSVAFSIVASGGGGAGGGADGGANGGANGANGGGAGTGVDGAGNGNLSNTGSNISLAGLGFGAIALMLIGAGATVVAARRRKASVEG